jgi:GNAT superfamily N-acetyltransferase
VTGVECGAGFDLHTRFREHGPISIRARDLAALNPFMSPGLLHHTSAYSPGLLIRQAIPDDATAIWRVLKAAVTALMPRVYTRAQVEAWIADENPEKLLGDSGAGQLGLVAVSAAGIIGYGRLRGSEIEALYVHPTSCRNRVGTLLLDTLEKRAAQRNRNTLFLDAALNAVRFYRRAGYRPLRPSLPLFDNGVALPCVRMQKCFVGSPVPRCCLPVTAQVRVQYHSSVKAPIIKGAGQRRWSGVSNFSNSPRVQLLCSPEKT